MYSRYNSRCSPPAWGFYRVPPAPTSPAAANGADPWPPSDGPVGQPPGWLPHEWLGGAEAAAGRWLEGRGLGFVRLRAGESVEEVLDFWNRV
jgi:hypothetical protein